jgi:hypothetical protein
MAASIRAMALAGNIAVVADRNVILFGERAT